MTSIIEYKRTNIMILIKKRICILISILICMDIIPLKASTNSPVDYVNPLMGTLSEFKLSNGNTYPAIAMPWGMNFWVPQTGKMGDGWIYRYDNYQIRGFKQTHQPSPWINDYGQFSLMPVVGNKINEEERASWFSHKSEIAKPHYYSVYLADYDITTEIVPTDRAACFRFTFPQSDLSRIVIDAFDNGSYIKYIPKEQKIIGYTTKNSGGVPENFKNYFVIVFDKQPKHVSLWNNGKLVQGDNCKDNHVGAVVDFSTQKGEIVHVRVASSFISHEQAELNLKEVKNSSFDQLKIQSENEWNKVLSKIEIEANELQKQTFYSCLYRSLLFPRKFYEINAQGNIVHYSPYNGKVLPGYMFTDTGFWDTFRSLFPLLNLVYPSINAQIQEGLLNAYNESGFLPEWASPGHRDCMVGNNSASVISDAILKGVTPKELWLPLYEAMKKTTNSEHPTISSTGRKGYEYYNRLGYVPYNVGIKENAARTLEYAYNDWCIWQVSKLLNRPKTEQELYRKRSLNYQSLYDKTSGLMRGKNLDGSFQKPFNSLKWGDAFTEGNSWHYSWSVFHDIKGLSILMQGDKNFTAMLDSVFALPPLFDDSYYGFVIHEIREMQVMNMGNYAHGNQPIQHMLYLYNYSCAPWKAQYRIREVMERFYQPTPDGYCGDEDNGQTSAWYVFSALGFYPVCPGSGEYVIGSPLVNRAIVHLENGKDITIKVEKNNAENCYIDNLKMNGKNYSHNYFKHEDLQKGVKLQFRMSNLPNTKRGTSDQNKPYSMSNK